MIKTRTEKINDVTYCAYCGKILRDESNTMYHTWPEPPVICQCEKAKEELRLYDEIKKLYNEPMHESLVDMKVSIYRDQLLKSPTPYGSFGTITTATVPLNSTKTITFPTGLNAEGNAALKEICNLEAETTKLISELDMSNDEVMDCVRKYAEYKSTSPFRVHYTDSVDNIKGEVLSGDIIKVEG